MPAEEGKKRSLLAPLLLIEDTKIMITPKGLQGCTQDQKNGDRESLVGSIFEAKKSSPDRKSCREKLPQVGEGKYPSPILTLKGALNKKMKNGLRKETTERTQRCGYP